jgi:type I restriction enzyme S subunit
MNFRKDKWERVKLSDICSFKNGFNFNQGTLQNGLKVIGISDFQKKFYPDYQNLKELVADKIPSEEYLLKKNDILFVRSNGNKDLVGRTLLINQMPFLMTFSAFCIRARFISKRIDPLFFLFYSKSDLFKLNLSSLVQGTYIKNISQGLLCKLEFLLPPLEEQKQIATLFQSLENTIEQVESQENNLFNLKNQLLRELFGETRKFGKLLSKNDFEKVKFEKIALSISERVEPQKTTLDIYVGLEHLEPDNLTIARTGNPKDVVGIKLKIYKL